MTSELTRHCQKCNADVGEPCKVVKARTLWDGRHYWRLTFFHKIRKFALRQAGD